LLFNYLMKSLNDSETYSADIVLIKGKMETLKSALRRFDKTAGDKLDLQQLQLFLDYNMRPGNKFDKVLAQKIYHLSDLDADGKLSTEEFIKTYLQIEEEIKAHTKELQGKFQQEKDNKDKYFKQMQQHKDEILNSEGIAEKAKVTIEVADIIFLNPIKSIDFNSISIRMTLHDVSKQTKSLSFKANADKNTLKWYENFEL
jgi:hypothetical protein